ncbi:MAG: flavodoxin domain-containing protein [Pseudomonadota bacterium]|nr:flavodoxin domain-containing protein [Pseudomonadota bacterium]
MPNRILVTYASRFGATAGVAEAIGATLVDGGAQVDVLPMDEVSSLAPYDAVVVGSAIQRSKWLPEALRFVETHRVELAERRVATFLVCMTLTMRTDHRAHVATWMAPVRALVTPVSEGLFAGALEIDHLDSFADRVKFRLSVWLGVWKEGDHRDWGAIRAWATEVGPLLAG